MPTQNPWAWVWSPNVGGNKEAPNVTLFLPKGGWRCRCHPYNLLSIRPFSSILLVVITLTLQILGKNSDIIKSDSDNTEGVLHNENRFQTFR